MALEYYQKIQSDNIQRVQSEKNEGRGVSCVRSALTYFKDGKAKEATLVCIHDNDKIRNYPDLQLMLFDLLPDYYASQKKITDTFGWEDPKETAKKEIQKNKPETFWMANWTREGPPQTFDNIGDEVTKAKERFYIEIDEYKVSDLEAYCKANSIAMDNGADSDERKQAVKIRDNSPFFLMFSEHTEDSALEDALSRSTYFCEGSNQYYVTATGPTKEKALKALGSGVSFYGGASLRHFEGKPKEFLDGLDADIKARLAEKAALEKSQEASRSTLEQDENEPDIAIY